MALEIRRPTAAPAGLVADRRLYLTRDGEHVVEDGDPTAAFLLATPDTVIPSDDVARLGLEFVDGRIVQRAVESEPPAPTEAPPEPAPALDAEDASAEEPAKRSRRPKDG
jgi:hypothetical protein